MRRHVITGSLLLTLLVGAPAWAQDADQLNQEAIAAFQNNDFEGAAEKFRAAYDADPDPIFRKSEAVAWLKADRCEPAVEAANAFLLEWDRGDSSEDEASSVIANCKINFAEEATEAESFDLAERLLVEAETHARDAYTRDRISTARVALAKKKRTAREADDEETASETAAELPPTPAWKLPAIITISAGSALVIAAGVLHVITLTGTEPALAREAEGGDPDRHARLARRQDTARILVPVLYGVGAATIGFGAWLTTKTERATGSAETSGGVSFSARF